MTARAHPSANLWAVAAPQEDWSTTLLAVMQGATLWLAFLGAGVSRTLVKAAIGAWLVASVITGIAATATTGTGDAIGPIVSLILIAVAGGAILRSLVRQGTITMSSVGGVVTVYLLIGLFFTYVYATIAAVSGNPPLNGADLGDLSAELYFTFVTLTTVGYGDLTPATDLVRGIAITQALIGQLYLVSVVALVVSNLGREAPRAERRMRDEPGSDPDR
jgi:hypothetical protein